LKYAQHTGTAWSIETVETGNFDYPSLALDADGYPHISYTTYDTHVLKYAKWTGSAWSIETVDSTTSVGPRASLALDSEGKPHISYYDEADGNLMYASTSNEYFASVNVTPFDSDRDGQNDAVEIQMHVDTTDVHGTYSGPVQVEVNAFLVDSFGYHADYNTTSWIVTDSTVDWHKINLSVPPGYFNGPSMYSVEINLFDNDDFYEDFYHEIGLYLYLGSTVSTGIFIESCNELATPQDVFALGETLYVYGNGFTPSTGYPLYVVVDQESWIEGMVIPERVAGTESWIISNSEGGISPTDVWHDPQTVGTYDIIVDVNSNGQYDSEIDALDNNDTEITAGLSVIPEFASILPFFMMVTLITAILLKRREQQNNKRKKGENL